MKSHGEGLGTAPLWYTWRIIKLNDGQASLAEPSKTTGHHVYGHAGVKRLNNEIPSVFSLDAIQGEHTIFTSQVMCVLSPFFIHSVLTTHH